MSGGRKRWILSLLAFLMPSILGGAMVGTIPGYMAYKFAWDDAAFCTSCHVHDYATVGWKDSAHGAMTTCHDCHHQPLRAYIREAYIMLKHKPTFPMDLHHTPYVKKGLCESCHKAEGADLSTVTGPMSHEDIRKIPKIDASHLHARHLAEKTDLVLENDLEIPESERSMTPEPSQDLNRKKVAPRPIVCADCHGGPANRGHNFTATERSCVRCHLPDSTRDKHGGLMREFGCRNCHFQDFLVPQGQGVDFKARN